MTMRLKKVFAFLSLCAWLASAGGVSAVRAGDCCCGTSSAVIVAAPEGCGCAPSRATGGAVCVTRMTLYAGVALGGVVLNSMLNVWHHHGVLLSMGGTLMGAAKLFPNHASASSLGSVGVGMLLSVAPHALVEFPYVGRVDSASVNMAGAIAYAATAWFAPQVLSGISTVPEVSLGAAALIASAEYLNDIKFFESAWQMAQPWLGWNVSSSKEEQPV